MNDEQNKVDNEQVIDQEEQVSSEEVNEATTEGQDVAVEETLEGKIAELEKQLAEQKDLTLRVGAELENLRRRSKDEVEAAHKYAMNKFVTSILPVKDNLEMALADTSGQFENMKFGVELTLKEFQSAFNGANIEEVDPTGAKLDPHFHQAMQTEESDQVEPNTILRVLKKGYKVGDRLLRPALVVVAVEIAKGE